MFRTLLILGGVAIAAFMAGWFTIDRSENETTIRFNRDEIRADASKAIAKGKELLDQNGRQMDDPNFADPNFADPPAFGQDSGWPQQPQSAQGGFQSPGAVGGTPNYPGYNNQGGNVPPAGYSNQQATRPTAPWNRPATNNQNRQF